MHVRSMMNGGGWRMIALLFLLSVGVGHALDTTWTNLPPGGVWSDAANWNNGVPDGNVAFLTNTTASYAVDFDGAGTIEKFLISNAGGHLTTLDINGGTLICANSEVGWSANGAHAAWIGPAARVTVNSGGTLHFDDAIRIDDADLLVDGGVVTNRGSVLMRENAALTVNSGLLYMMYNVYIPYAGASSQEALMTVNGGYVHSRGTGATNLRIGMAGSGRLQINGGAFYNRRNGHVQDGMWVGMGETDWSYTTGRGAVDLTGGSLTNEVELFVGYHVKKNQAVGDGTVTISGGVWEQQGDVYVGFNTNDLGRISISGTGRFQLTPEALNLSVGRLLSTGEVAVAGGELSGPDTTVSIGGWGGSGSLSLSGGTATVKRVLLAPLDGPGSLSVSAGLLETEDLICTDGSGDVSVAFALNGSTCGTVSVSGDADLGGTLTLTVTNPPVEGRVSFPIFDFASAPTGAFDDIVIQGLETGYELDLDDLYVSGTITLHAPPLATMIVVR